MVGVDLFLSIFACIFQFLLKFYESNIAFASLLISWANTILRKLAGIQPPKLNKDNSVKSKVSLGDILLGLAKALKYIFILTISGYSGTSGLSTLSAIKNAPSPFFF